MRNSFIEHFKSVRAVEIGVRFGDNAREMLDAVPHFRLYLVDSYDVNNSTNQSGGKAMSDEDRAKLISDVKERFAAYGDRAKLMVMDSAQASRKFPDKYFDYVYIDAQHEEANVLNDIRLWWPKLKDGGTFGGHDLSAEGVKKAVIGFFDDYHSAGEDWWVFK